MMTARHPATRLGVAIAAAVLACTLAVDAKAEPVRKACGEKPPMLRAISDEAVRDCRIDQLNDLAAEYAAAAEYYWCRFFLAKSAKEQHYDDVTYNAVQAQIDLGKGLINAAKGRIKGPKGGKDTLDAIVDISEGLQKIGAAAEIAGQGFDASASQDESFRMAVNAMHQADKAQKIAKQMQARAGADPDCRPPDDKAGPDDGVAATYSGFGITVEILRDHSLRIISDCRDPDHRIQLRGPTGTWSTKGVGEPEVLVPGIDPTLTYAVRRRCDHRYSPELVIDIPGLTATSSRHGK